MIISHIAYSPYVFLILGRVGVPQLGRLSEDDFRSGGLSVHRPLVRIVFGRWPKPFVKVQAMER